MPNTKMPAVEQRERERDIPIKHRRAMPPVPMSDNEQEYFERSRNRSSPSTPNRNSWHVPPRSNMEEKVETTIGVTVKMKGKLSFERLLRIDGEFEGSLSSKGSLIIGKKGQLIGDVKCMKEVVIEGGRVVGNIQVDKVTIRAKGSVHGNITAKIIKIDTGCIVVGTLNVNPHAPNNINLKGEIIRLKKENSLKITVVETEPEP